MSIFQPIISGDQVEQWVLDHLENWMETYLREVELQRELDEGTLARPRSYVTFSTFMNFLENQTPAVVVVAPGLGARPTKYGGGAFIATFQVAIAVVCSARDQQSVNKLAKLYGAAVRAIMVQQPSMGQSEVRGVDWLDESYDEIDSRDGRTLGAARVVFNVEVANVVNALGGPNAPADPVTQPGSEWPEAETTGIVTNIEEG